MNPAPRTLPSFLKYPVFLVGIVSVLAIVLPVVAKGSSAFEGKISFLAAVLSVIVGATYLVGLRTFLSGFDRAELKFVFAPFVVANIVIATVFISVIVFVLIDRNVLGL